MFGSAVSKSGQMNRKMPAKHKCYLKKKTKENKKNKKRGKANLKDGEVFPNVSSGQEVFLTVTF